MKPVELADLTFFLNDEDPTESLVCAEFPHADDECEKCQPLDGVTAALLENVANGDMLLSASNTGVLQFKLTEQGKQKTQDLIATDPEAKDLVNRFEIAEKVNDAFRDVAEGTFKDIPKFQVDDKPEDES